jgi:hypothetical protein
MMKNCAADAAPAVCVAPADGRSQHARPLHARQLHALPLRLLAAVLLVGVMVVTPSMHSLGLGARGLAGAGDEHHVRAVIDRAITDILRAR